MTMRVRPFVCALVFVAGCGKQPMEIAEALARAIEAHDVNAVERLLDPSYADPLGDEHTALADLKELFQAFPRIRFQYADLSVAGAPSELLATVTGRLDAEWVGSPTWRVVGPAQLELVRTDGLRIRSGLLTDVRDIRRLARARIDALEANDAEAMRPLLHPAYRDGDLDADEALARLSRDSTGVPIRLAVTNYRLELRGPLAHLDEHYVLTVGGRTQPPAVAGFTLKKSAGRWKISSGLYRGDAAP